METPLNATPTLFLATPLNTSIRPIGLLCLDKNVMQYNYLYNPYNIVHNKINAAQ